MSQPISPSPTLAPALINNTSEIQQDPSTVTNLTPNDLDELRKLPLDTFDTIRSKLVQLIEAVTTFRFQLESAPHTSNSLTYPTLISKFLILLNHTEALSQAINTPAAAKPINRFELPQFRAEREERSKWEDGPSKRSLIGNLAVVPRGLEGLEDGKEWIVGVLTRTKLAPEIENVEQELLDLLPPPPPTDPSPPTIRSLMKHVKHLTSLHEEHITNCRTALHTVRYKRHTDLEADSQSAREPGPEGEEVWEWKMRVEVDDNNKDLQPSSTTGLPSENPMIKGLLGFMRDGRSPLNHGVDGI
ncbi:uncharacterized protein MELLADRAFT_79628 [Melampsora larici-populina 98AG31]|uniref:Uncharacterized protein n=1 Tax=Melampsora larici-populina (strain 98AG31 / pathotype 3-4-7) TaxID=747676 RepID=F4S9G5_MELLP|nr:uncharacterized protein MELLADRAFT_79628 [Melampsora larici-populina 98AG31]EGF98733.1 hypothetical protein MELLADRAFT_79628 [Melampsora larici-populina 98AG31]